MMRHNMQEIEPVARQFQELADNLDPATVDVLRTDDQREVAVVADVARTDEARLREAVQIARAHGRSWNKIALALGVARQAARQRFADTVRADKAPEADLGGSRPPDWTRTR